MYSNTALYKKLETKNTLWQKIIFSLESNLIIILCNENVKRLINYLFLND